MSAQDLSLLQEEARQIIQEMEKQELELFIKTERAAGKKGWYLAWVLFLLSCFLLVCVSLCVYR
jgi:predicted metal-binding protein